MKKSNADLILEAIQDLHAQEQVVTRETLAEVTGLKLTVIDDRVAYLIDNAQVHRVQRGVFVPAPDHKPARIINKTILPDGTVKLEIGDDHVLTLTPRENRNLGELMAGAGQQFAAIEVGHHTAILASELSLQIKNLKRELAILTTRRAVSSSSDDSGQEARHTSRMSPTSTSTKPSTKRQLARHQKQLKANRQKRWRENARIRAESSASSTAGTSMATTEASTAIAE